MSRIIVAALVTALAATPLSASASQAPLDAAAEVEALRALVAAVPPGASVRVHTKGGRRLSGTLMQVTGDAVVIKRSTRAPEPAVAVAIADIARLERAASGGGLNLAKAIGIGVGAGAGVILALVAIAFAVGD